MYIDKSTINFTNGKQFCGKTLDGMYAKQRCLVRNKIKHRKTYKIGKLVRKRIKHQQEGKTEKSQTPAGKIYIGLQLGGTSLET